MATTADRSNDLSILCYNLHGLNQGFTVVDDLIANSKPHLIFTAI